MLLESVILHSLAGCGSFPPFEREHGLNFGMLSVSAGAQSIATLYLTWAQWKSFDFFEVTNIKPQDSETISFLENDQVSCACSGSGNLFLGSYDGYVRILSSSFKVLQSFQAYETGSITHMKQVEGTSLLVTIAVSASRHA